MTDSIVVEHVSKILSDNPLGDPHVRKLGVWLPPQYDMGTVRGKRAGRGPSAFGVRAVKCRPLRRQIAARARAPGAALNQRHGS